MILRYDTIADMRRAFMAQPRNSTGEYGRDGAKRDAWYNNETIGDVLRYTAEGNTALVPQAERLLDSLDTMVETPRKVWERAPAGVFCCVPDVLAGLPTPMRRQIQVRDEHTPITILVNVVCSVGINAQIMSKRGTTILALVMALSRLRPVSLQILATMHGKDTGETIMTGHINTSPLDLASACYVLTSVGFARRLTYGLGKALNGFNGQWPLTYTYGKPQEYYDTLYGKLGLDRTKTLLIPAAEMHDPMLTKPVEWINEQVAKFAQTNEEN